MSNIKHIACTHKHTKKRQNAIPDKNVLVILLITHIVTYTAVAPASLLVRTTPLPAIKLIVLNRLVH